MIDAAKAVLRAEADAIYATANRIGRACARVSSGANTMAACRGVVSGDQ